MFIAPELDVESILSYAAVQHEYGHTEQLNMIGFARYIFCVAIPSVLSRDVPYTLYYRLFWEASADFFGGVVGRATPQEVAESLDYLGITRDQYNLVGYTVEYYGLNAQPRTYCRVWP